MRDCPAVTPITVSLTADPVGPLTAPGATTLSWTTTGTPDSCTASNYWSGAKTASGGSELRSGIPASTQIFDITCSKTGTADATASVSVVVNPAPVVYSCTGTVPTNATAYAAPDNTGLTADTAYTYSAVDDTAIKCQYKCATNYTYTYNNITDTTSCVALLPDLTASAVSPVTATIGTAFTLSATVSNDGNASTGVAFWNLFQKAGTYNVATDIATNVTNIGNYKQLTALSAGGSITAWISYVLSSAGTYYIRACADKRSSLGGNAVPESNEDNNCGPWTNITASTRVDGACVEVTTPPTLPTHYICFKGTSKYNVNNPTSYTWACIGSNGGTTASCTESKSGVCSPDHYKCASGTSSSNRKETTAWTWVCTKEISTQCFEAVPFPDLQPVAAPNNVVTPTTATVGVSTPFGMQIRNTGNASTVTSFNNRLRKANDAVGTGSVNVSMNTAGPLASDAQTSGFTISYTPVVGDVGTKWFSVCADENMRVVGSITESNASGTGELNNCGAWTAVTVSAPPPPASCTLPWGNMIASGVSVQAFEFSSVMSPAACPASQTRTCNNGTLSGSYTNSNCTVLQPSATISADPMRVRSGGTSTITWTVTDTTCDITRSPSVSGWPKTGLSAQGSYPDTITGQTVYTITCTGVTPKSVTVNVVPTFEAF